MVEENTGGYHFLVSDTDPENIAGTALEQDDLLDKLETGERPHNRVLVLSDTCQAGALADSLADGQSTRGAFVAADSSGLTEEAVAGKASAWVVYSAGMAADKALEGPEFRLPNEDETIEGHGLFTYALLQALGSQAADSDANGLITLAEFQLYVNRVVRTQSQGQQIPRMSGRNSDIPLAWAVGTPEGCDGIDNDFDGQVDEGFPDQNGNGVPDCLDHEICNGIDDNGNGVTDEGFDLDGDGHTSMELCGTLIADDCNDYDLAIHPGQDDWANLRDDDCDGLYDEDSFDKDESEIPDSLEQRSNRLRLGKVASLGVGVALTSLALVSYGSLNALVAPAPDDQAQQLPDDFVQTYRRRVLLAGGLGVPGVLCLGVSGTFAYLDREFRATVYPAERQLQFLGASTGHTP